MDDRKLQVLRAIVEDYVATQEPVGSKALVERHKLGVSPATVRNDMAALEEEGLHHPAAHQRRPDPDRQGLPAVRRPARRGQAAVGGRAAGDRHVPRRRGRPRRRRLQRTVRLLAQLTQQVAIVQYPTLSRSTVRHVEVVALTASRLLLVLIPRTGRVEQRVVELPAALTRRLLAELRARLNARRGRTRLADAAARARASCSTELPPADAPRSAPVVAALRRDAGRRALRRAGGGRRHGQPGPLRRQDFEHAVRPVLEALEEHVVLLKLLGEARTDGDVTVRIGHESPYQELRATRVVATGYGAGATRRRPTLGIVGPTRMDYPGTMAAVRAVARYVSRILDEG